MVTTEQMAESKRVICLFHQELYANQNWSLDDIIDLSSNILASSLLVKVINECQANTFLLEKLINEQGLKIRQVINKTCALLNKKDNEQVRA